MRRSRNPEEVCFDRDSGLGAGPRFRRPWAALQARLPRFRGAQAVKVQLSAVLRPGHGRLLRTDADIIKATAQTLRNWRQRVEDLAIAKCPPFYSEEDRAAQAGNAMACPVAFVMIYGGKKQHRPCKLATICPFCCAREVRRYWLKVDAAFFPPPPGGKRRVRMVDTGPKSAKSSSFTRV
jgi:hypothetical protein